MFDKRPHMINVQEATQIVLSHRIELAVESVSLSSAYGKILREPLQADRPFPPYDRVTMDGIAIQYAAYANGQREFQIIGMGAAGQAQATLSDPQACVEIMTGAILPTGADTVIPYEQVEMTNGMAKLGQLSLKKRQNVHPKGGDRERGEVIVAAGKKIQAPEIGIAAAIGKSQLKVSRLPKAAIISSGDELVPIEETPLPYQIRTSNVYTIQSMLSQLGIASDTFHLRDNIEETVHTLTQIVNQYPLMILSGGVSKGKFDFIPQALEKVKVEKKFHRIAQRPGKPFWFGVGESGIVVFALPGNPVSSFMCANRYILPWLYASMDFPLKPLYAALQKEIIFKPDLTYFAQVKINYTTDGELEAIPLEGHGSGDFANLVQVDGFMELAKGKEVYEKGEVHPIWPFRNSL